MIRSARFARKGKSLWSATAPSARLAFGAFIIVLAGVSGMLPREFFGLEISWPFAALWGAMGWGRVGLSVRPMLLMLLFGLMQDVISNAPLGCFAMINLLVYGLSALIARRTDAMRDRLVAFLGPMAMLCVAFILIWGFASITADHLVPAGAVFASVVTTGLAYLAGYRIFDLGRRPGEAPGQTE